MRNKHKNIYMGANSTAKLPVFGKVDTDNEICLNAIATAYDSLNSRMLTRQPGVFDKTTPAEINGRFSVLRLLCRNYAPDKLIVVNEIHKVVMEHYKGNINDAQAINLLQSIISKYNLNPGILNVASLHINQAEQMANSFGLGMFSLFNQSNIDNNRKRRGLRRR